MRITLTPTDRIVHLQPPVGESMLPTRIWDGTTDQGVTVHCFVAQLAAPEDQNTSELEAALQELPEGRAFRASDIESAAAAGDPLATFMLQGLRASKATAADQRRRRLGAVQSHVRWPIHGGSEATLPADDLAWLVRELADEVACASMVRAGDEHAGHLEANLDAFARAWRKFLRTANDPRGRNEATFELDRLTAAQLGDEPAR